jgi:4-hydroxy-2-oxoheptanedioate aldolase
VSAIRTTFAARLRGGEPLNGLIVKMPCASLLELAGHSGFDFAMIDTEHGPSEVEALEHHLRAADSAGLPALVRVASGAPSVILHALDAGAAGIVAPHVDDAETARRVVRAAHYPPLGARGLATSTRAGNHGMVSVGEHVRHAESTIVVVQIEDEAAVPNAGAIAGEPGVDAVFLGPSDLSMSLGHPGDLAHPLVAETLDGLARTVVDSGAAALCAIAGDEREARAWQDRGARMLVFVAPALIAQRLGGLLAHVNDPPQPSELQR